MGRLCVASSVESPVFWSWSSTDPGRQTPLDGLVGCGGFFRIWSDVNDVNNDWYWMILVCLIVSVNLHNMWRPRSMTLMTHYQTSIWTYINIYQRSFILTYQISSNLCLLIYQMNLKDPPPAFQKLMAKFWACIFVARRFRGTGTMWIWIRICMCKACSKSCSIVLQILCMTWKYGFI